MKDPLPKQTPPEEGDILDDRIEGPFDKPPPTPEEVRRGEARQKSFGIYWKERPSADDPDKIEKEERAVARHHERVAAINAQYEKEVRERKPEEARRVEAIQVAWEKFYEERPSADDPNAEEKDEKAFANYGQAIIAIEAQYKKEISGK